MNTQHKPQYGQLPREPLTSPPEKAYLKSERVQAAERMLKRLQLPGWKLGAGGTAIRRAKKFARPADAEAFAAFVGKMATSYRQPVTIRLTGRLVLITLTGRRNSAGAGGLTNEVFNLAAVIG